MIDKILYPGSFDPVTLGHEDIISQLCDISKKVYVGVAKNNNKNSFLSLEQRLDLLELLKVNHPNIIPVTYEGLTVELANELEITYIARGIRNQSDYIYEKDLTEMNYALNSNIRTVYFQSKAELLGISSSLVRQLISLDKNFSPFVNEVVFRKIKSWR